MRLPNEPKGSDELKTNEQSQLKQADDCINLLFCKMFAINVS